jgi:hypothetical protein
MTPPPNPPVTKRAHPLTENRRQGNRHRLHIPATLLPAGDHPSPISVTVTEISIGGVGIRAKHELKLDNVYHLNSFDTLIPPGMKVHIVSQRKLPDGHYEVGARAL